MDELQARLERGRFYLLVDADAQYARARIVWGDGEHATYAGGHLLEVERERLSEALDALVALLADHDITD